MAANLALSAKRILFITDTGNNRVVALDIPQGEGSENPLDTYQNLIDALLADDINAAVNTYVASRQKDRRILFESIQINISGGLIDLGQKLASDQSPILVQKAQDMALYIIIRDDNGTLVEYELELIREDGVWRINRL